MIRYRHTVSIQVVVPMHSEQVARIRCVLIQSITDSTIDRGRIGELGKGWKDDALFFESLDTVL